MCPSQRTLHRKDGVRFMRRRRYVMGLTVAVAAVGVATGPPDALAAGPRPAFQLPFPCGQQWRLDSWASDHAPALDMVKEPNQVGTEGALLVAPAGGTVNQSFRHSRAGNMIQINHGGGWFTTYIHLQSRSVSVGAQVSQGEAIGRVGKDGETSNGHPHLHYELAVDSNGDGSASWGFEGSERVPPWFDGVQYGTAAGQTYRMVTSRNCGEEELPPPPPRFAPALLRQEGDGTAVLLRWDSNGGGDFNRIDDWRSGGTFTTNLVGDRLAAGDVNGDGETDLVAVKQDPAGTFVIHVWRSGLNGPGSWYESEGVTTLDNTVAGRLVVGDWDGDGKDEPAMLRQEADGTATILRWDSDGSQFRRASDWRSANAYDLALVGDRLAAGDVNDDGRDDIVAAKQNSDGTFSIQVWRDGVNSPLTWYRSEGVTTLDTSVAGRFVVGDWDGDGRHEPAMFRQEPDGTATILRWDSNGGGVFDRTTDWRTASTYTLDLVGNRFATADVNGDRDDDYIAVKQNTDGTFSIQVWRHGVTNPVTWYRSDGTSTLNTTVAGRLVLGTW
jgi:peptidase M23-like protein/VCBS repeat protein